MFYFFEKGPSFIRCQIRPVVGSAACDLVILEPSLPERVEHYPTWEAADIRWRELTRQFHADGWTGPLGRE